MKNILKQYTDLQKEIREHERRIQSTRDKLKRLEEEGTVTDVVSGGDGGIQHYTITGYPARDYSKQKSLLQMRELRLKKLRSQALDMQNQVEKYIASIDNSEVRRIAMFRYIDKMHWPRVAVCMGHTYTADACRKILDRYINSH